uniref:AlNc14C396G11328 protein n=1 Tax=Albugo laibachii Nc14 TaxID=890382 RepID=F0WYR7_9STRA|nr:AlNc14C396G11328 [Albugo laibachii Nc14]|eukprot:CCA26626.1 AlNc14C396G11328 [Albugo laibachii Nc14]
MTFAIHYNCNETPKQISAYSDTDWGNNLDDCSSQSTNGQLHYVHPKLSTWH